MQERQRVSRISCEVRQVGEIDALAYWFRVKMLHDQEIYFDTEPNRADCGWDQAIMFMFNCTQCESCHVSQGQPLVLECSHGDDSIDVRVIDPFTSSELSCSAAHITTDSSHIRLGEMDIAMMNDNTRNEVYAHTLQTILAHGPMKIVELVGNWTAHTIAVLADAAISRHSEAISQFEVLSVSLSDESTALISNTAARLPGLRALQMTGNAVEALTTIPGVFNIDVCIGDVVEGSGMIRQQSLEEIFFIREFLANPSHTLNIAPCKLRVIVQLAECASLMRQQSVSIENTVGIDVASHINIYGATQLRELDLKHMDDLRCAYGYQLLFVMMIRVTND